MAGFPLRLYRFTGKINAIQEHYTKKLGTVTEIDITECSDVKCKLFYVGELDESQNSDIEAIVLPIGNFSKDTAKNDVYPVLLAAKVTAASAAELTENGELV